MSTGWIKIHRQLLDWEWYSDVNTTRLFLHLLLVANHKDNNWRGISIKRGQRLTSVSSLAAETNLSIKNIRTSIKRLKATNEVASHSTAQHTVFTVINYDLYQEVASEVANEGQAKGKQGATNKNDKNDKNDKNEILSLINDVFDHWWNLYPKTRRKNKGGCLTKLKAKCKGLTDDQIIELADKMTADVARRVKEIDDIKYLPATESYLNQERWKDEE